MHLRNWKWKEKIRRKINFSFLIVMESMNQKKLIEDQRERYPFWSSLFKEVIEVGEHMEAKFILVLPWSCPSLVHPLVVSKIQMKVNAPTLPCFPKKQKKDEIGVLCSLCICYLLPLSLCFLFSICFWFPWGLPLSFNAIAHL